MLYTEVLYHPKTEYQMLVMMSGNCNVKCCVRKRIDKTEGIYSDISRFTNSQFEISEIVMSKADLKFMMLELD